MASFPGTRTGPSRGRTPAPAAPGVLPGAGPGRLFPERGNAGGTGGASGNGASSAAERRRARAEQQALQQAGPRALPRGRGVIRKRFSRLTVISVALLAIAAVGLTQVLQTSRIATIGYEVRALEVERQSLSAQIRVLETEIAGSTNLDHLRSEAINRLGMVPAGERIRVQVDVPAPHSVPLPRRYVPEQEHEAPISPAWWERWLGHLPGIS
jgi:hypothetical protein